MAFDLVFLVHDDLVKWEVVLGGEFVAGLLDLMRLGYHEVPLILESIPILPCRCHPVGRECDVPALDLKECCHCKDCSSTGVQILAKLCV